MRIVLAPIERTVIDALAAVTFNARPRATAKPEAPARDVAREAGITYEKALHALRTLQSVNYVGRRDKEGTEVFWVTPQALTAVGGA